MIKVLWLCFIAVEKINKQWHNNKIWRKKKKQIIINCLCNRIIICNVSLCYNESLSPSNSIIENSIRVYSTSLSCPAHLQSCTISKKANKTFPYLVIF